MRNSSLEDCMYIPTHIGELFIENYKSLEKLSNYGFISKCQDKYEKHEIPR